jgi:hypothetical protein
MNLQKHQVTQLMGQNYELFIQYFIGNSEGPSTERKRLTTSWWYKLLLLHKAYSIFKWQCVYNYHTSALISSLFHDFSMKPWAVHWQLCVIHFLGELKNNQGRTTK